MKEGKHMRQKFLICIYAYIFSFLLYLIDANEYAIGVLVLAATILLFTPERVLYPVKHPTVKYYKTQTKFKQDSVNKHFKSKAVYIGIYMNGSKPNGCFVECDKTNLKRHKLYIKKGRVKRSSSERFNAHVYGKENVSRFNGLFHRTHLIPFRYCLKENLKGNLVMATACANMGDDFLRGYRVPSHGRSSHTARVDYLIDMFLTYGRVHINRGVIEDRGKYHPLSLDDYERFFDYLINSQKTRLRYTIIPKYKKGEMFPYEFVISIRKAGKEVCYATVENDFYEIIQNKQLYCR